MKQIHHLFLFLTLFLLPICLSAQRPSVEVVASKGTNQTTGTVVELSVRNNTDELVELASSVYFIPGRNGFQSYVVRIPPGTTVPPGATTQVPGTGYCTSVGDPPIPAGTNSPDFNEDWVMIADQGDLSPTDGTVPLVPEQVKPPFTETDIPGIITATGFTPNSGQQEEPNISVTFPGTDTPIPGTIVINDNPADFAPLLVSIVNRIKEAAPTIQQNPAISTPFSGAPDKELEAMIQQTVWISTATLTGITYSIEEFRDRTFQSFTSTTGIPVEELPEEDQEKLNSGVEDFWGSFTAVGLEAKVFNVNEQAPAAEEGFLSPPEGTTTDDDTETEAQACSCDKVEFQYMSVSFGNKPADTPSGRPGIQFPSTKSYEFDGKEETITYTTDNWPNEFTFYINDIVVQCSCSAEESCIQTEGSLSVSSDAGEVTSKDGKNTIAVKVPEDEEKTFKVTIKGSCASVNCEEATCEKVLVFKIVRKTKEDAVEADEPQEDGGVKVPVPEGTGKDSDENNGQGDGDSNKGTGSQPDQQDGQPEDIDEEKEGDQCECQNMTLQYKANSIYSGDLDAPSGQPTINEYEERAFLFDGEVGKSTYSLPKGHNQVDLRFKDIVIRCACTDGTCTLTEGSIAITSDTGKVKVRDGVTSVTIDAKGSEDQKVRVTIKGQCGSDDCVSATCTKVLELTIDHPED